MWSKVFARDPLLLGRFGCNGGKRAGGRWGCTSGTFRAQDNLKKAMRPEETSIEPWYCGGEGQSYLWRDEGRERAPRNETHLDLTSAVSRGTTRSIRDRLQILSKRSELNRFCEV